MENNEKNIKDIRDGVLIIASIMVIGSIMGVLGAMVILGWL